MPPVWSVCPVTVRCGQFSEGSEGTMLYTEEWRKNLMNALRHTLEYENHSDHEQKTSLYPVAVRRGAVKIRVVSTLPKKQLSKFCLTNIINIYLSPHVNKCHHFKEECIKVLYAPRLISSHSYLAVCGGLRGYCGWLVLYWKMKKSQVSVTVRCDL